MWKGKGASDDEVDVGKKIWENMGHNGDDEEVILEEGAETEEFWALLGGKGEYLSDPALYDPSFEPRLFAISNCSGGMRMEECFYPEQEDLRDNDVMLIDA